MWKDQKMRYVYFETYHDKYHTIIAEDLVIDGKYLKFINVKSEGKQNILYMDNSKIMGIEAYNE